MNDSNRAAGRVSDARPETARTFDGGFWEARGRAVYGLPGADPPPDALSVREAEAAVARRLGAGLRALPEALQDAAIDAAARGYLDAHRALGRATTADPQPPAATPTARPTSLLQDLLTAAPGAPDAGPVRSRGSEHRAVSDLRVATFTLAERHPIAKGLSGGRARILDGEDALRAVARRIARDTRCAVVAVAVDRQEAVGGVAGTIWHCRVTLRGSLGPGHPSTESVEAEIGVVVRDFGAEASAP